MSMTGVVELDKNVLSSKSQAEPQRRAFHAKKAMPLSPLSHQQQQQQEHVQSHSQIPIIPSMASKVALKLKEVALGKLDGKADGLGKKDGKDDEVTKKLGTGKDKPLSLSSSGTSTPSAASATPRRGMNRDKAFVADHYKTEICRTHRNLGYCEYQENCQFAHGIEELRPRRYGVKYKTQLCKNYHVDGHCRFGSRCKFIHDEQRIQVGEREFWLISPSENLVRVEVVENSQRASQLRSLIEAEQQRLQQFYQQNGLTPPPTIRPHLYPQLLPKTASTTPSRTSSRTSSRATSAAPSAAPSRTPSQASSRVQSRVQSRTQSPTRVAQTKPQAKTSPLNEKFAARVPTATAASAATTATHVFPTMASLATSPLPSSVSPAFYTQALPTFYTSASPSPEMPTHAFSHVLSPPETPQGPLFTITAASSPALAQAQASQLPVYGYNITSPLVNVPYSLDYHLQNLSLVDASFLSSPIASHSHSPSPQPVWRAYSAVSSTLSSSLPSSLPGSLPGSLPSSLPNSLPSTPPSVARRLQHLKSITAAS